LKIAWISYFPVEWLPDGPEQVRSLPRQHPATWQRVLIEELTGQPGLELHVLVVRKQFPANLEFTWRGVQFHCLKVPGGMRALSLFWWETILIRRALRSIRPDLVHAWGVERGAALVASRLGHPYLVTIQGLLRWYLRQIRQNWAQVFEASLERPALRRASVVTTESTFGMKWLAREYPHLKLIQAEHAPNWLYHKIERRPSIRPLQFLFVGVMSLIKGTDILIKGLDRLQTELDFTLTIVGGGSAEFLKTLKAETSPGIWERITFRQGLSPEQVAEEMARATIMVFPTRADTSPNSVKEAVVAGLPIVASAVGGIPDYVQDGKNGITFAPNDIEAFMSAVRTAVAHPLMGTGQVDQQTMVEMRDYLSPARMKDLFLGAYRSALEQHQRHPLSRT
jgi:glycosyltransferase involved in cell wall biosynthesis